MINKSGDRAHQNDGLSRRRFIGVAGAAGSAAALGILGANPATADTRAQRIGSARTMASGMRGDVGATVPTPVYPGAGSRLAAAKIFDSYVSPADGANVTQKYYFNEGQWPATDPLPSGITQLPGAYPKFKWLMCFKPTRSYVTTGNPADQQNLKATCEALQDAKINFDVVLWQEPNVPGSNFFANGTAYVDYVSFYRPYVPSGINVVYDSSTKASTKNQQQYYPSGQVDKIYCDFYGNTWKAGKTLDALNDLAVGAGLPFGLGEWGFGSSKVHLTGTPAQQYVTYITDFFTSRLAAGETNGAVIYYDGSNSTTTWNIISSPTDWKVPLYRQVYNALAPV